MFQCKVVQTKMQLNMFTTTTIKVFPVMPFYLQMHHKKWMKNQRVKYCVNRMTAEQDCLDILNLCTGPKSSNTETNAGTSSNQILLQPSFPALVPQVSREPQALVEAPQILRSQCSYMHWTFTNVW